MILEKSWWSFLVVVVAIVIVIFIVIVVVIAVVIALVIAVVIVQIWYRRHMYNNHRNSPCKASFLLLSCPYIPKNNRPTSFPVALPTLLATLLHRYPDYNQKKVCCFFLLQKDN